MQANFIYKQKITIIVLTINNVKNYYIIYKNMKNKLYSVIFAWVKIILML